MSEKRYGRLRRRRGTFYITSEALIENTKLIRKIMSKCIILRCEYSFMEDMFHYHAISPLFDVLCEGEAAPQYSIWVDGYRNVKAVKMVENPHKIENEE